MMFGATASFSLPALYLVGKRSNRLSAGAAAVNAGPASSAHNTIRSEPVQEHHSRAYTTCNGLLCRSNDAME